MNGIAATDAEILDRLYAASFDPEALTDALRMIAVRIGSMSLNMRIIDTRSWDAHIHVGHGPMHTDPAIAKSYFGEWMPHDTHMHATAQLGGDGRILTDRDMLDTETIRSDPYLNEFYYKIGCGPIVGWLSANGVRATMFGALRAIDQDDFDAESVQTLHALQPHIDRALRLAAASASGRLTAAEVAQAQNREQVAIVRCAGDGRILLSSPGSAEVIGAGGATRMSRDRLIWRDPTFDALFTRVCRAAVERDAQGPCEFVVREADGAVLRISAAPGPGGDTALVIIRRLRSPGAIDPGVLQASFGLSATEARVAIAVAQGMPLPDVAARHGVSHATVRTQLRIVFGKLGVRRQSELAALLARLA